MKLEVTDVHVTLGFKGPYVWMWTSVCGQTVDQMLCALILKVVMSAAASLGTKGHHPGNHAGRLVVTGEKRKVWLCQVQRTAATMLISVGRIVFVLEDPASVQMATMAIPCLAVLTSTNVK